jgi:hypothetical protein
MLIFNQLKTKNKQTMERHVNTVATFHIIYSIFGLILSILLFALFHTIGNYVDDKDAELVLSIIANVIMVISAILSLPGILAGIGLYKRKEWARILALIVSVLQLFSFPFGTALGIYSIWALVQPENVQLFKNA